MRPFRLIAAALLAAGASVSLAQTTAGPAAPAGASAQSPPDAAHPGPKYGTWGVDLANMNTAVKPGDDFFRFAVGHWLDTVQIPSDRRAAGYNYDLEEDADKDVRAVVEQAVANPSTPSAHQVGDYYAAWMDESGIEARGLAPLQPYLARIRAVDSKPALVALMLEPGFAGPVGLGISPDDKDPTYYAAELGQERLGLPARDYYLLGDAKYVSIRKAYRDYLVKIQTLAGIPDAAAKADAILALETQIAKTQWTPEQRRDPIKTYNPMDRSKLAALAPQFAWAATLDHVGLGTAQTVIVREPSAVSGAGQIIASVPLETWKDYMIARFVSDHAGDLPHALDQARFDFYSHTLSDIPEQQPRWKRGVHAIDNDLGEAVGQLYVTTHWTPATDAAAKELIGDMRAAYADKIGHAPWMDDATRQAALAKLATFDPRVGHPVKYIDYSTLAVSRTDPLANAINAERFEWNLLLQRYPHPVDRTLWYMTPQEVNAYYEPTMNQITFPAAILQPPFFDAAADPAVNYGETGATIGHEMGHGFDDEGRQYDPQGRLRDWWTPTAAARYKVHADALARQYDAYEPIPGTHIKGQLTLGENLADLGGLEVAYDAYRRYVSRHGEPPVIDGYTGDQRFFLAYAQSWQGKERQEALRQQLLADPHSPEEFRVNGVVRNVDEWYAAFGVKPSDKLYLPPDRRVHVW